MSVMATCIDRNNTIVIINAIFSNITFAIVIVVVIVTVIAKRTIVILCLHSIYVTICADVI